jgi:hypothetical protein
MFVVTVPSSKPGTVYTVRKAAESVWVCDCPDHVNRSHGAPFVCKHIAGIAADLADFATKTAAKSKRAAEILDEL